MAEALLKNRLKDALQDKGLSALELARLSDVKPSFVYDILSGKSANPNTTKMARISSVLGVDLSILMGLTPLAPHLRENRSEYVMVSRMLATARSADGAFALEEREGDPYYFRRNWVHDRLNAQADDLRLIFIEGDSMEPTLSHGDTVLIDTTRKTPSPPGIFVLFDGMGLVAKRLEFMPHSKPPSLRILSDNPQYHPYERSLSDTQIIGRVVWFAREM